VAEGDLSLQATVRFLMGWLVQAARGHRWGELRVVVQDGRITAVHEHSSYRGRLPVIDGADLPQAPATRELTQAK
jgi:hypothetical protein